MMCDVFVVKGFLKRGTRKRARQDIIALNLEAHIYINKVETYSVK